MYAAFRALCDRGDPFRPEKLGAAAVDLQAPLEADRAADLAAALKGLGARGGPAPLAAAEAAEAAMKLRAGAEALALWVADAALAKSLGWPVAAPLLAGEVLSRRGAGEGRRPKPDEAGWTKVLALAYARAALAALDLAQDLARRAARLADAAPKLRAKGKGGALEALLVDDAVSAAAPIPGLTDRARRRLFERLVAFGAAASSPAVQPSGSTGIETWRAGKLPSPTSTASCSTCRRNCAGGSGRRGSKRSCSPRPSQRPATSSPAWSEATARSTCCSTTCARICAGGRSSW
jgi:hypothetical protein